MSTWGKNYPGEEPKKSWTIHEAKGKLETFCAYQERCQWDVRRKLFEKGIHGEAQEELIAGLISDGFLNEERFARAFARGKFRLKRWGKSRISRELAMRQISKRCIQLGLSEIDLEEYAETLQREVEKKWLSTKEPNLSIKKYKVIQYLMSRGFEQDLIQDALELIQSQQ